MNYLKMAWSVLKDGGAGLKESIKGTAKKYILIIVAIVIFLIILISALYALMTSFLCQNTVMKTVTETVSGKTNFTCPEPPVDLDKVKDLADKLEKQRNKIHKKLSDQYSNEKFRSADEVASAQGGEGEKAQYSEAEYFIRTMAQIDLQTYLMYVNSADLKKGKPLDKSPIDISVIQSNKMFKDEWTNWFRTKKGEDAKFKQNKSHYLMNYRLLVYECFLLDSECDDYEVEKAMGTSKYKGIATQKKDDNFAYKTRQELADKFYEISFIKYLDGKVDGVPKGKSKEMFESMLAEGQKKYNDIYPDTVPGSAGYSVGWIVPLIDETYNHASPFGPRSLNGHSFHYGLDLGTHGKKPPIFASKGGTVVSSGWNNGGYGGYITIDHGDGFYSSYNHLKTEDIVVRKGQQVQQGQLIAAVDGQPHYAKHLHFEICTSIKGASGFDLKGGPVKICDEHRNPEDEDLLGKVTQGKVDKAATASKYETQFQKEWKAKAMKGEVIIMPGFTPASAGGGGVSGLGQLSARHESHSPSCNRATENSKTLVCGHWQLTGTTLNDFVNWSQKHYPEFYAKLKGYDWIWYNTTSIGVWDSVTKQGGEKFQNAQHDFLYQTHFKPVIDHIKNKWGYDTLAKPLAIQEMMWSTGVQIRAHTYQFLWDPYIKYSWKSMSDAQLVTKFYDLKIQRFRCCTPRYKTEKQEVLYMLKNGKLPPE